MNNSFLRAALVLGLLSAIGPFAIDMYLPALPAIENSLHAGTQATQMSLMFFFMSMALSQLVFGPASDIFGRKPPLYFGIGLFAAASIGCALAPDIQTLIAFRFVQGLGAGAGVVVPRAIVRDLHIGTDAARLMSLLMLVFSVSPILSPVLGSFIIEWSGWRGIFWIVTASACIGLIMTATVLDETRSTAQRAKSTLRSAVAAYGVLMRDRQFLGLSFIGAFGISAFVVFLANSPFVLIQHYGLSPRLYSLAFSVNAASFIGVAQITEWLGKRVGLEHVVRIGVAGCAIVLTASFVLNLIGIDRYDAMAVLMFIGFGFLGLVIPTTAVLSLEDHGEIAGAASALMGTLQLVSSGVIIAVVALFIDGTARPMLAGIAACALAAGLLAQLTLGSKRETRTLASSEA